MAEMGGTGKAEKIEEPEATLEASGLEIEKLDDKNAAHEIEWILQKVLRFNPLDTGKNRREGASREEGLRRGNIYEKFLKMDMHGTVLIAKDGEKIVGLVAYNRHKGVGSISQMWVDRRDHQEAMIWRMLQEVQQRLQHDATERCDHCVIEGADNLSPSAGRVFDHTHETRFFIRQQTATNDNTAPQTKAANDNFPSALDKAA